MKKAVRVSITGAAGNIGYALVFRIAAGDMFGPDQPVILQLLEVPQALEALQGVVMELEDGAFPLVESLLATDKAEDAFDGANYVLMVGAKPRGKGMERKDLLQENARIFAPQGKALNAHADRDVRVLVVGNPANSNALITAHAAPKLERRQISAMTRLDHNRALAQLANKTGTHVTDIKHMTIWGNHSATQYPDINHCTVGGKPATSLVEDAWVTDEFIPTVQKRGAAIIQARGASSAASAASAAVDAMHDWMLGTPADDWVSMGVASDGSYGVADDLIYSYPVTCKNGEYSIVQNLEIDTHSRERMQATEQELREERDGVQDLL